MKRPEILAPAGNMECLIAAISAGADAVYISGKKFGARAFANNFDNKELQEAIVYAHLRDVKVYVTVNTLIYENEMEDFVNYVGFLYKNNVDAIIIQDLGAMDLVRKLYPDLEIHASTQMNIHSTESVKLLEKLNIKRAVLSRELSIDKIKEIKNNTNIELEIFVQGALCISYSGECLMSALIGNRSGNRGTCAQCCRMKYDLIKDNKVINDDKYILSTKDLCTLNNIDKLIDIGVDSLKIEGRMKRKEYVYLAVSLYKKAVDSYINKGFIDITLEDIKSLKKIFNREFTKGFIFNENNDNFTNPKRPNNQGISIGKIIDIKNNYFKVKLTDDLNIFDGIRIKDDDIGFTVTKMYIDKKSAKSAKRNDIVTIYEKINSYSEVLKTTDYRQIQSIDDLINQEKKVPLDIFINAHINKKVNITFKYKDIIVNKSSDYIIEEAKNSITTKDDIKNKLNRLKDTVYYLNTIEMDIDNNIFIPVFVLNNLRRNLVEILNKERLKRNALSYGKYEIDLPSFKVEKKKSILVDTNDLISGYDEVYNFKNNDFSTLKLNRIVEDHSNINKRVLVSELGSINKYKNVVTDFGLNVTNSYTVALLHSFGVNKITLSYELSYKQIKDIIDAYHKRYNKHPNLEVIVYGYPEVMVCKYRLNGDYIKDKFGNLFKIRIRNNYMYIYHYNKIDLKEDYYKIGVNSIRYNKEIN